MIRTPLIAALLPLAACAPTPPADPVATTPGTCVADPAQDLVGRTLDDTVTAAVKARTKAATVRVIRPNMIVTMEYNPARVDITVDDRNTITRIGCG